MKLNYSDYIDILKFYNIDASKMKKKDVKAKAENLLATKLCKCIKSIKYKTSTTASKRANVTESRAIAICYNSIIKKKGLKTYKFKCKNGAKFLPKRGTRKLITIEKV